MIHAERLLQSLQEKAEEFHEYQHSTRQERRRYHELLDEFALETAGSREARLALHDWPGALPTWELEEGLCLPFGRSFSHHQEARSWAAQVLKGRTTFAVDGSQLMPTKELSVPVAVVQVGWFQNPHHPDEAFEKDVQTQVLGPQELLASGSEEKLFHDQYISLKRYELETSRLEGFFASPQAAEGLAFFDGSLLVSFAEVLIELHRDAYVQATLQLLEASQDSQAPLFGYIDTTVARDLVRMLSLHFFHNPPPPGEGIRDTDLLDPLLEGWGDRSAAFELKRQGILKAYGEQRLGFVYLRAAMDRPPVRVEFPLWMLDAGVLDDALDLLRAELIVGNGYPYALETADQIAWFSPVDRARFSGLLQHFLQRHQLDLQMSHKYQSKRRRR